MSQRKTRNWHAVNAHMRRSGPMPDKRKEVDWRAEAMEEMNLPQLKEIVAKDLAYLKTLLPQIVRVAQKCYDDWDVEKFDDPEGFDMEYAGGGICHFIADEIVSVLDQHGIEAATVNQQVGDQHVFTIAQLKDGVYAIDIPPGTYETGGGYTWQRRTGVKFDTNDVFVDKISDNPEEFEDFIGE